MNQYLLCYVTFIDKANPGKIYKNSQAKVILRCIVWNEYCSNKIIINLTDWSGKNISIRILLICLM